jgi:hypothetical protein
MLICYGATLFLSAFLLFSIQPMAGKMLLPLFGGTPAVWNACMVFFQAALLCGYGYAHLAVRKLGLRRQPLLHLLLMLLALLALPPALQVSAVPPGNADPAFFLLYLLTLGVGLPFFIVSSSAPLLQRWFAETTHPAAGDPYFLYAASNLGSLTALLGYPLLFEPLLPLDSQGRAWSAGYGLLLLLTGACLILRNARKQPDGEKAARAAATVDLPDIPPPSGRQKLFWLFSSFVPSSLMLGTTTYLTTNLAAIPLLWVLPLALYLATFILVFARKRLLPHRWMVRSLPFAAIAFAPFFFLSIRLSEFLLIPLHLLMFFLAAMVCHGELAASRPHPYHLTGFYLWMSVGGVLGGAFNALAAPLLFDRVIEYPLGLFLVCLVLPGAVSAGARAGRLAGDLLWPLLSAALASGLFQLAGKEAGGDQRPVFFLIFAVTGMVCFACKGRRLRFALGYGVLLLAMAHVDDLAKGDQLYASRNFYGVKRVIANPQLGVRVLYHGTTMHGCQRLADRRQAEPMTYYHRSGPAGDVFALLDAAEDPQQVAVVGLGAGSLAGYARPGRHFVFFEIDPEVVRIARDSRFFSFLSGMEGSYEVVLGDGRLTLSRAAPRHFDVVVLDAFSSDAIPVHLLTKEAVGTYLDKLKRNGLLVFHISNRFLDLEPLMAGLARELDLHCLIRRDCAPAAEDAGKLPSDYVVMGRDGSLIGQLEADPNWRPAEAGAAAPVWTDQYSNLTGLLKW